MEKGAPWLLKVIETRWGAEAGKVPGDEGGQGKREVGRYWGKKKGVICTRNLASIR